MRFIPNLKSFELLNYSLPDTKHHKICSNGESLFIINSTLIVEIDEVGNQKKIQMGGGAPDTWMFGPPVYADGKAFFVSFKSSYKSVYSFRMYDAELKVEVEIADIAPQKLT